MPSLRTIVQSLALSSMIVLSTAAPVKDACGSGSSTTTAPATTSSASQIIKETSSTAVATSSSVASASSVPTIPASGAVPDLSTTTLSLAYVALGHGVQNYTCDAAGATGKAIGAIATLYDVTSLAYTNPDFLHTLTAIVVNEPVTSGALNVRTAAKRMAMPVLGNHYFDAAGVPVFDLSTQSKILYANKTENVKAPSTASKGPLGTGAVDWLKLIAKLNYVHTSVGLEQVYRIETAGGVTSACNGTGVISVPYAAEYWFYA